MQRMKIVELESKQIKGISTRTTNAGEMNPQTAKIGALHQKFDETVSVNYKEGARVYGVYYNYESDHAGAYSVMAGADRLEQKIAAKLETLTLPAGTYMVFAAEGEVPQVVIETWSKIWGYFSSGDAPYQRNYTTDFEFYKNQNEIEIYIALKK